MMIIYERNKVKKSKIDEIIDDAMKFIDDECQILNEKEIKILNSLS